MRSCYLLTTLLLTSLAAHPKSCKVISGDIELKKTTSELTITALDKTILHWKDFSIDEGETTRFILPSHTAAVLNRVIEANSSRLLGNLESNGRLFLVNPNGIVIGKDSVINAASFIASTFDVLDHEFLQGKELHFFGSSQERVTNCGKIKSSDGDVILLGFRVDNQGNIESINGTAALVSHPHFVWTSEKNRPLYCQAPLSLSAIETEENLYSTLFSHSQEPDALLFVRSTGDIVSKGQDNSGGRVVLIGENIVLENTARIDVSGQGQGGQVVIGGDYQGKNQDIPSAHQAFIGKDTTIHADAIENGNGGKIVVWSDGLTQCYGYLSAKGGERGGAGGLAEVSGKYLDYQGLADLRAPDGTAGTLLLDPITISVVGAGVIPAPAMCVFCNQGAMVPMCATYNNATVLASGVLSAQLGLSHVLLDATTSGAPGDITINTGANITWMSNFNLGLNATGNITINANIQNSAPGTGNVFIRSGGGTIAINTAANTQAVSVGSQNGTTQVCAPNADLILRGANAGSNRYAQLGFYTPAGGSSSGLIFVDALNVSLIGGATAGASNGAQIGHGEVNNNPVTPGILVSTLAGAAINVNAVQNITLSAGNNACPVFIGHGAFRLGDGAGANQNGDITVTAGGQITLNTSAGATGNSQASIGHGTHQANDAVLGAGFNATGNIIVRSVGPLTLNTTTAAAGNHSAQIGHFGYISGSHIATAAGDIDISCGDLTFTTGTSFGHSFIGHHAVRTDTITGIAAGTRANYRILVNGNLLMTSNTNLFQAIGYTSSIFLTPVIDANLLLLVNGNLTMTSTFASTLPLAIGFKTSGNNNTTEYIGVGGNISVTANHLTSIETSGDVVVAAGGSVTLTGSSTAGGSRAEIGTDDNTLSQTIIRAKGDVLAINGSVGGAFIGQGTLIGTPGTSSVEVRAGGDIQFAQNYVAIGTGSIFIEADSNFCDGGELWTNPMGTLTALGGQPLPAALQINANLPPLFQTSSTAQIYDQNGAFRVTPPAGTPLRLSTVSGNITLNSADTRADGATLQDLIIGTAAGQTQIDTTSGNIRIFGSVCPLNANPLCPPGPGASEDSFNNITITAIADPWTSGSILVSANNDLTVNDTVHTTGVANCITLRADNEDDGTGVLTINQNLTTNNGEILLDSGFNAPAGTSSILQTLAAVVDSNGGAVTFQSVGNTTISGGVNSVTTDGGAFIAHSQRGDVIIDENVLTTTGAVGGNATVTADLGSITLGTGSGTGGSITSATGNILLTAGTDINIQGQPTSLSSSTGFIHSTAGRNTTVSQQVTKTGAGGDILMISGVSMFIVNTTIAANAAPVTFVVDNAAPNDVRPNVGPGIFSSMGSFVNSGPGQPLRIFTALQQLGAANNQIFVGSLFNGVDPYSAPYNYPTSPIFTDTPYEVWCVYFSDDPNFPYPIPNLGFPFTIFYKPCLQRITVVANTVVSQLLFDLNPPDEWNSEWMHPYYPPYIWKFMIGYDSNIKNFIAPERERYWLSHKHLQLIHQPRVYKTEDQLETLLDKISKK